MSDTKQTKAITAASRILEKKRALLEACEEEIKKLDGDLEKVAAYLVTTAEVSDVPQVIKEDMPFLAWQLMEKNDALAIEIYRTLRETVQESNRKAKDFETINNEHKDTVGNWLLKSLNESGANSVNCGVVGKAYKKLKVQASAADWDAFLHWVDEQKAYDAVQKRVNSSFVSKYEEENGELPPFLNVHKEFEVIVTK
jgi:hypothetical protein